MLCTLGVRIKVKMEYLFEWKGGEWHDNRKTDNEVRCGQFLKYRSQEKREGERTGR